MATLIIEHSDHCRSDRLGATLRDHGHRLRVVRVHAGDPLPGDLDGIDAVVSCGGPQSPLDDALEWIEGEMDLLRAAHAAALPVLGLCLGCQLLARALGGTVEALEGGPMLGWHPVTLTPGGREDPIYAGLPWTSTQLCWHGFHVSKPPDGARILARSERTPVQAWASGLRSYAMQYHPEAYPDSIMRWAADEPEKLRAAGLTVEDLRAATTRHDPVAARLAERLFKTVALVLMPVDRRYEGAIKDLHY